MWISRQFSGRNGTFSAERGIVSKSDNGRIDAGSSVNSRDTVSFSPYGYSAYIPKGEEVLLLQSNDGQVALGTKNVCEELEKGEIRIASAGGAQIVLKNDGSVIINGRLMIDREGDVSYEF